MSQENPSALARLLRSPLALLAIFGMLTAVVAGFAMGSSIQVGNTGTARSELSGVPDFDVQTGSRGVGLACPIIDDDEAAVFDAIASVVPHSPREGQLRGLTVIPTSSVQYSDEGGQAFPEITALVGGTPRPPANPSPFITQSERNLFGLSIEDHALWLLGGASLLIFTAGFVLLRRARDL